MKVLHVYSGGLDSTVALASLIAGGGVSCVNFSYGAKHNEKERWAAIDICLLYQATLTQINIDLSMFKSSLLRGGEEVPEGHYTDESMRSTVVPFRNAIMLSYAVGLAESWEYDAVSIGVHGGDHAIYPDCRATFFEGFVQAAAYGTHRNIKVLTPLLRLNKTEIVRLGARLKAPLEMTWSCYKGGVRHCGKCGTCVERREAFKLAGVKDHTLYEEA
jgi:7-cyano-7-deazaguanine synthase